jgi:hypothetical protein
MASSPVYKIYQGSKYHGSMKCFIHAIVLCDFIENSRTEQTQAHAQIRMGHRKSDTVWDLSKQECQKMRHNGVTNYDLAETYLWTEYAV